MREQTRQNRRDSEEKRNPITPLALFAFAVALTTMTFAASPSTRADEAYIVKDGEPKAQIVVSPDPRRPRMAAFAALELRRCLEKMTGAKLPIVTKPTDAQPVKIYVGESEYTDKLGVTAKGLKYEAFKMKSGDDWLVLLGADWDYAPTEPWARSNSDRKRAQEEWDKITEKVPGGGKWGALGMTDYKFWWNPNDYDEQMTKLYGEETKPIWDPMDIKKKSREYQGAGMGAGFWMHDRGGTLNAVCEFLRTLGVRWYMPDEDQRGEVVPKRKTVELPKLDETVRPEFPVRFWFWYNYAAFPFEHVMWARRLGIASYYEIFGPAGTAHGHTKVHGRKEMREDHPEYYALIGDERDLDFRNTGRACYSSEGLFDETVRYARFLFDHYDAPSVSLFPQDGFVKCECAECGPKTESEVVWEFVDRVARELYKTHPDRLVTCGAYTSYAEPPDTIDKFSPNVAVFISNSGRAKFDDPVVWKKYQDKVKAWRSKIVPGNVIRGENNRFGLNRRFPVIHPHAMAKDLKSMKGVALGDLGECAQRKARWHSPGFDHLTRYVQSRFLWNPDQDLDAMLDEYYEKFYGPAAKEMKKAFEFAEKSYVRDRASCIDVDLETRVKFAEMLQEAKAAAGDTIYGERVQILIDEMAPLDKLRKELAERIKMGNPRDHNPVAVAADLGAGQKPKTYHLANMKDGSKPDVDTTFTVVWDKGDLVFDIHCLEPDMENVKITDNVWSGDSVSVLLETPSHSYYQVECNPEGTMFDADRYSGMLNQSWESLAKVDVERGDDEWRAIIRIPVVTPDKGAGDPIHNVVGDKPAKDDPWFFNVGRVRFRDGGIKGYSFSPTQGRYHSIHRFGKLIME